MLSSSLRQFWVVKHLPVAFDGIIHCKKKEKKKTDCKQNRIQDMDKTKRGLSNTVQNHSPPAMFPPVFFQAFAMASKLDSFLVCWSSAGNT